MVVVIDGLVSGRGEGMSETTPIGVEGVSRNVAGRFDGLPTLVSRGVDGPGNVRSGRGSQTGRDTDRRLHETQCLYQVEDSGRSGGRRSESLWGWSDRGFLSPS